MLKRKKIFRLLSFVVIIALVLTSVPVKEVRADESSQDVFIITSFEKQNEQMPVKDEFAKGTKIGDMSFPAEWDVKGYVQSDESKTLVEKTLKELTWRGKLKDAQRDNTNFYTAESPEGEYIFELQLPENMKTEEGIELPAKAIKIVSMAEEIKPTPEEEKPEPEKVGPEKTEPEPEKVEPEKVEPEKTEPEPEKVEPEKTEPEPEKVEPEKAEPTPEPEEKETEPEPEKVNIEPEKENTEPEKVSTEPEKVSTNDRKTDTEKDSGTPESSDESDVSEENSADPAKPTVKVVIKDTLPERIVKGASYKINAQLENVDGDGSVPVIRYEVPSDYQEIVRIDENGNLTVTGTGLFKVNIFCDGVEGSLQTIERIAELPENDAGILSFTIGTWKGEIEHGAADGKGHILITVPYETNVTDMVPKVILSGKYAKVTPASEEAQNFNRIVVYTVTAEDGTLKSYDVEVKPVCTHEWTPATCTKPETCKICKETRGEALGHKWNPADCATPETCEICKETRGEALGHKWNPADCTTPETCSRCKVTRGSALGHNWGSWKTVKKPTTKESGLEQRICSRCQVTENREISRLNIIGKPENNKVTGIQNKGIYRVDQLITITAYGDGMDIQNPIANDVRYLPVGWKVTSYYKLTQSPYQVSFSVKSEGDYQLQVYFQKQVYDGKNWISQKETDVRKVNFTISNSKITPVKTGDGTPYEMFVLTGAWALVVMAAGLGWMIRRRKHS